jgi:hypothetical protein
MKRLPVSLFVLFFSALFGGCLASAQVPPTTQTNLEVLAVGIDAHGNEIPNVTVPGRGKFSIRFSVRNISSAMAKGVLGGVLMMPHDMLLLSDDCDEIPFGDIDSGKLYTKACKFQAPQTEGKYKINFGAGERGAAPTVGSIMVSVGTADKGS